MSRAADFLPTSQLLSTDPAQSAALTGIVDDNSDNEIDTVTRAIYVGSDGDLRVKMKNDTDATFVGVKSGTLLPIQIRKVFQTGTTANNVLYLW